MGIADLFRLDGRCVLITGGGGGLGRAMAVAFAEMGADIALTGRRAHKLEAAAADVQALGRRAVIVGADLADPASAERIVAEAVAGLGKLDILVNNAGGLAVRGMEAKPTAETSIEDWSAMIELNLNAAFRMVRAAVPVLADGGSILSISSIKAFRPENGSGPYGAAKAAINHMTLALSQDLAPRLRVNAIAPGPIATAGFLKSGNITEADYPRIAKEWGVPMGRVGLEQDVAAAAVYLASPAAGWITGQTLVVAGGM